MSQPASFRRDVALPVGVTMGLLFLVNFLWNARIPDIALYRLVPEQFGVYLTCCIIALVFVVRALRRGTLALGDAGLGVEGWKPGRRLIGLGMTVALVSVMFATLGDEVQEQPAFGDYCFWLLFLLPASMTELLVFVTLGFCLPERWLRDRGWRPAWAKLTAGSLAGIAFGLYHFTHEERFHKLVLLLTVVMWITLTCFVLTRNFHLAFVLHNGMAAVGFSADQYHQLPPPASVDPATYQHAGTIAMYIVTFAVPYLALLALEWQWWPARRLEPRLGETA